jgi:DNA-binding CsgD family transcriptional regulator
MEEGPTHDSAIRAYRAALAARVWDLQSLGSNTGLSPKELLEAQKCLIDFGLLAATSLSESDYMPLTPDAALRTVLESTVGDLTRATRQLEQARDAIHAISVDYQPLHAELQYPTQVEVVTGRLAMSRTMEDAVHRAYHSVKLMYPGPQRPAAELQHETALYRGMLKRGVRLRSVHRTSLAAAAPTRRHLRALSDAGARVRVTPALPTYLVVVDSNFAILPMMHPSGEPAVLTLRSSPLINFVSGIFEYYWDAAVDLPDQDGVAQAGITQQHDEVLRMLASGLHDDGVARRLGVSTRTVRRLVAESMEQLGAHSRFQAGVRAAVQGRVGPEAAVGQTAGG